MWKHLADFHNIDRYGKMVKDSMDVDVVVPYQPKSAEQKAINWKIARWMVVNKRPFNCAEAEEFKDMFT
jgi:hypothetical protein